MIFMAECLMLSVLNLLIFLFKFQFCIRKAVLMYIILVFNLPLLRERCQIIFMLLIKFCKLSLVILFCLHLLCFTAFFYLVKIIHFKVCF